METRSIACSPKHFRHARIPRREAEGKETWRAVDDAAAEEFKRSQAGKWGFGAEDIIMSSTKVIRVRYILMNSQVIISLNGQFGLYDRPELKTWHQGRVFMIGDAAHPTSPVCLGPYPSNLLAHNVCHSTSAKVRTKRLKTSIFLSTFWSGTTLKPVLRQRRHWMRYLLR